MGLVSGLSWGDRVCDLLIGPSGDSAYHFHEPYSAGNYDDGRDNGDRGFVIIMLHATNPAWHTCLVDSALRQFRPSIIYLGNVEVTGTRTGITPLPADLEPLRLALRNRNGSQHGVQLLIDTQAGDRFLGKLALGFGALHLGESFVDSADTTRLRDFMWSRDSSKRNSLGIKFVSFAESTVDDSKTSQLMQWKDGHSVFLLPHEGAIVLHCVFFGRYMGSIEITQAQDACLRIGDGIGYLVSPANQRALGPIDPAAFLLARAGQPIEQEVSQFLEEAANAPSLPPRHLDGRTGIVLVEGLYRAIEFQRDEQVELAAFATLAEAQSFLSERQAGST